MRDTAAFEAERTGQLYMTKRDELATTVEYLVRPAVRAALDAGVPIAELARMFGTSRTSIRRWATRD